VGDDCRGCQNERGSVGAGERSLEGRDASSNALTERGHS